MGFVALDLTGQRFGRWTALYDTGRKTVGGNHYWMCKCDCGTTKEVDSGQLRIGGSKSCGCHRRDRMSKLNLKHGGRKDRLYLVWMDMRRRCNDPKNENYFRYGGRGIKVDEAFNEYADFKAWAYANGYDDTAKHGDCTIDRIDVNGNYSPDNCRWVNLVVQANNRRSNAIITYNGKSMTRSQWEKELGFKKGTLAWRINAGWTVERMLTQRPEEYQANRKKKVAVAE